MEHGMKIFILLTLWMFAVRTAYCSSIFKELSSINLADKTGKHDQILIEEPGMIDLNIQILVPNSQIGVTEITSAMSFMRELYPYLIKVISVKNETYCGDSIDTNVCTSAPELSVLLYAVVNDETTYTYSVNLTLQTLWLNIDLFGGFSITPIYFTQSEETVVFINFDYDAVHAVPNIYYRYNSSAASVYLQVASAPCKQTLVQQIPESFYSSQENVEETRNLDLAVTVEPGNIDLKILVVVPMIQRGNIEIASTNMDMSELHPLLIPIKTTDYCGGNATGNPCTLPGPVLTLQLDAWVEGENIFTYSLNITDQPVWLNINLLGGISVTPIYFSGGENVYLNFVYNTTNGFRDLNLSHNSTTASINLQTTTMICSQTEPQNSGSSSIYHTPKAVLLLALFQVLLF